MEGAPPPIACAGCGKELAVDCDGPFRCPSCGRRGECYRFIPVMPKAEKAAVAMPHDAVCAHHPTKRADAICAGTGDYICSLCAVEIDGKTYGLPYLNRGGKPLASQAFQNRLPRPDRAVSVSILLSFVVACLSPVTLGAGIYYFVQMLRKRKSDPLYASIVGMGTVATQGIILAALALGLLVFAVLAIFE